MLFQMEYDALVVLDEHNLHFHQRKSHSIPLLTESYQIHYLHSAEKKMLASDHGIVFISQGERGDADHVSYV